MKYTFPNSFGFQKLAAATQTLKTISYSSWAIRWRAKVMAKNLSSFFHKKKVHSKTTKPFNKYIVSTSQMVVVRSFDVFGFLILPFD